MNPILKNIILGIAFIFILYALYFFVYDIYLTLYKMYYEESYLTKIKLKMVDFMNKWMPI
jgi:hypothetical protein